MGFGCGTVLCFPEDERKPNTDQNHRNKVKQIGAFKPLHIPAARHRADHAAEAEGNAAEQIARRQQMGRQQVAHIADAERKHTADRHSRREKGAADDRRRRKQSGRQKAKGTR